MRLTKFLQVAFGFAAAICTSVLMGGGAMAAEDNLTHTPQGWPMNGPGSSAAPMAIPLPPWAVPGVPGPAVSPDPRGSQPGPDFPGPGIPQPGQPNSGGMLPGRDAMPQGPAGNGPMGNGPDSAGDPSGAPGQVSPPGGLAGPNHSSQPVNPVPSGNPKVGPTKPITDTQWHIPATSMQSAPADVTHGDPALRESNEPKDKLPKEPKHDGTKTAEASTVQAGQAQGGVPAPAPVHGNLISSVQASAVDSGYAVVPSRPRMLVPDLAALIPSAPIPTKAPEPTQASGLLGSLTAQLAATVVPQPFMPFAVIPSFVSLSAIILIAIVLLADVFTFTYGLWLRRGGFATAARSDSPQPSFSPVATPLLLGYASLPLRPHNPLFMVSETKRSVGKT